MPVLGNFNKLETILPIGIVEKSEDRADPKSAPMNPAYASSVNKQKCQLFFKL